MTGGKRYGRYVDDFINSHRYIDCNSAVCRNCHEMNIHIIRGLLLDCTSLVKSLFTAETFSFEECMALKQKYDIAGVWFDSSRIEDSRNAPPLSFGCNFSREQMTGIVACANAYHLFCGFHSPHRGHGSAFCLQGEFLYTCEQYPPCGGSGSMRCSKTPLSYLTGSRFSTRGGSCCQRRHKICYRFKPLVCPLCGEEQHYIGNLGIRKAISRLKI